MLRGKTVGIEHNGHRLLGLEYGDIEKYSRIQLRTPVVPSLVITPRTGAFEPERFTPIEDARITRNTVGAQKPDATLRPFEAGSEFDRRFSVTTSDEDFARAVLDEVRELLLNEPWFRVREVAFHDGALWTTEAGRLTEERVFDNSRQLARLAAAVPAALWGEDFASGVDTSEEGWHGRRKGGPRAALNRRRVARDRQPLSALALTVRTVIALVLLLPGLLLAGNALAAMTGVAPEVKLVVTGSFPSTPSSRSCSSCGNNDMVSGTYDDGGTVHDVYQTWWMTWSELPAKGDVVDVSVGPLWWHPVVERTDTAVFLLLIALLPLLTGALLTKMTVWPRPRKKTA